MGLDFSPLGVVKGVTEGIVGYDIITGKKLDLTTRIIGAIPIANDIYKSGVKLLKSAKKVETVLADGSKVVVNIDDTIKTANKVAGYYASDIRNMTLTEMRNVGTRGWNKTVRMLKGDAKDAYNFYRARAVEIMGPRNIEKKFPDGSPVEQVLTEGFDKNGYKINFRNFSTEGEGNYPTIDLYNTNGKSKYEIKFEE